MEPNRVGTVKEYKKGHIYLTIVDWEDGHCEIELHQCIPELLFHSCDKKDIPSAIDALNRHFKEESEGVTTLMDARKMLFNVIELGKITKEAS